MIMCNFILSFVDELANMDILEKNVLKDAWKHVLGATMSTGCVILDVFRDGLDTSAIKVLVLAYLNSFSRPYLQYYKPA